DRVVFVRLGGLDQVVLALKLARLLFHLRHDGVALLLPRWRQELLAEGDELVTQLERAVGLAGAIDADHADVPALVPDGRDQRVAGHDRVKGRLVWRAEAEEDVEDLYVDPPSLPLLPTHLATTP